MKIVLLDDPQADALREKGLSDVVRKAFGVTGEKLDYLVPLIFFLISVPATLFGEFKLSALAPATRMAKMLVAWSTLGNTYAATILGFLVAGFSVFTAVSDKMLFLRLASYRGADRSLSQLKVVFFTFMYVFACYLILILASTFLSVTAEQNSLGWYLGGIINRWSHPAVRILAVEVICGYLALLMHSILILRSFIWNLYSSVLISIFSDEQVRKELSSRRTEPPTSALPP